VAFWRLGVVLGGSGIVNQSQTLGGCVLRVCLAAGFFVCIDFQDASLRSAHAFDVQLKTETKQDSESDKTTFKGGAHDSVGLLGLKFGGTIWDMNPSGMAPLVSYDLMSSKPVPMDLNDAPILKSTLADTHVTLGVWDDWVVWTSRQAVSNYVKPTNNLKYLIQPGFAFDDVATSQHIDASVWKTASMGLSLFCRI
jgi:hypothetical protein